MIQAKCAPPAISCAYVRVLRDVGLDEHDHDDENENGINCHLSQCRLDQDSS